MRVAVGDDLDRGQVLFEDKQTPGVRFTAAAAGTVSAIHRGDRRALQSVVIDVSRAEYEGRIPAEVRFSAFSGRHPSGMSSDDVIELLTESGVWVALRARPFGRVADPATRPHSIFVTATDSHPHAPSIDVVMTEGSVPFDRGLAALTRLTDGPGLRVHHARPHRTCPEHRPRFSRRVLRAASFRDGRSAYSHP